jgi:hypothetical protein
MFLKWRGFNIDSGLFNIKFNAPQNFASYRQSELDNTRIQAFTAMEPLPYMSKRFMLERFLGLSEDEIQRNEELWREERDNPDAAGPAGSDLRSVGVTPGGMERTRQSRRLRCSYWPRSSTTSRWSSTSTGININMLLNEFYQKDPEAYQDLSQDNSQPSLKNLRKTRLTLRQLNKLRKMNDIRSVEYKEKIKLVRQQYQPPAQPAV